MFKHNGGNSLSRILTITLGFALTISLGPLLTTASLQVPAGTIPAATEVLTNDHVLRMLEAGIGSEIIIAKIKASPTHFDTSPSTIQALKEKGMTDVVVLAMIQSGSKTSEASTQIFTGPSV